MEEQKLLKFYDTLVDLFQKNQDRGRIIFAELANSMLCGHELGDSSLHQADFYELLILRNTLCITNDNKDECKEINLSPFAEIDEKYYQNLLKDKLFKNIITYQKICFISRLTSDLTNYPESYAHQLVKKCRPYFLDIFKNIEDLNNVIRNGWIKRKVDPTYNESDVLHSLQMLVLASACFRIYPLDHLNKQKVFEMIIIHEIAEIIIGDIMELSIEHLSKSEKERIAVHKIFSNLKHKEYFINLWEEFEKRETEEARFAYQLDKIDPVLKARYLDKMLNRDDLFDDFYDFEDRRETFIDTPLHKLFYSNMS